MFSVVVVFLVFFFFRIFYGSPEKMFTFIISVKCRSVFFLLDYSLDIFITLLIGSVGAIISFLFKR